MEQYLNEYKGKNILITGGAGCIGSNLAKALIKAEAAKIIILDDLSSAEEWNIPVAPNVIFIQGSILNEEMLKRAFSQKLDFVFHLAAHFANQNSLDHPETDLMVNGVGTLKLLQYANLTQTPKFVFASSGCSVYGSQAPLPLKEEFVSLRLDTPYQITKLLGELYCNYFHAYYGLPIAIARYFNVFGPGEIPGTYRNVIPNYIYKAIHKQKLPITGTGEETRDFTYVDDVVDGTLLLGVVPEAVGDAFNLASGTETKLIDLVSMVNGITGNPSGAKFIAQRSWDKSSRRRASIEKARKTLGYKPKTNMKEGIKQVYDWIVENRDKIEARDRF